LFLVAIGIAAFGLRGFQRAGFTGDGVGYYAPLASLLVDGDLDLANELAHLNRRYLRAAFMTPDGSWGNPFPVGPAHLWGPAVIVVHWLPANRVLDANLPETTRTRHPGFTPRHARAVLWTNQLLVVWAGVVLCIVLASFAGATLAATAVCAGILGTPTFFYALQNPSYGHTASFFVVSLFICTVLLDRQRRVPLEVLGVALGLVVLVRSQDALLGVLVVPRLVQELPARRTPTRWIAALLRLGLPVVILFAPQMVFWQHVYGRPLLIPPGPDFLPWWKPHLPQLLLSTWNGAFLWSPMLAIGCVGLLTTRDRSLRWAFVAALVLEFYSSSVLLDWWGGRSFGARRLVSIAPLAIVGLVFWGQRLRGSRWQRGIAAGVLVVACVWNLRLAVHYRDGLLPGNPGNPPEYLRHPGLGPDHATPYGQWDYARFLRELWRAERLP